MEACFNGNLEIAKLIFELKGVDINAKISVFKVQFSHDFFIFQNDIWNFFHFFISSLIGASANGHLNVVQFLHEQKGINVNDEDILGNTAIIFAIKNKNTEIVELLKKQKGIIYNANEKHIEHKNLTYERNGKLVANPQPSNTLFKNINWEHGQHSNSINWNGSNYYDQGLKELQDL